MNVMTGDFEVLQEVKRRARATWAAGDYDIAADGIWRVGAVVTAEASVRPGDKVLDVACGTGNAAIQAAQAGGAVTGVDLTPELFRAARRRAAEAGVEIELLEGDAEALPFDDATFDVVLSTFGVMFAPRHAVAAGEIVRVLRPGGRIALANWAPEGSVGDLFRTMARHLPSPPPIAEPPLLWGTKPHVQELLGRQIDLRFTVVEVPLKTDLGVPQMVDRFLSIFPPLVTARAILEPQGRWEAAEAEIRPMLAAMYTNPPTYLVATGTKRA
ncbi:MAG TPA: class I SAM-dependent methyltransferase [Bauldia sp.]|nr:class I SAM-dependent methyltransferase [Bauldia sp.]